MTGEKDGTDLAARAEQIFADAGAYREGHFKLKSGRHADRYLEKFQVLQWPERVAELCAMLTDRARAAAGDQGIEVVVGPTTGGVILAYEVARQLGVRGIFAEQVAALETNERAVRREFRRGFAITPGERVLLVDDVVTTGASLAEMIPPVEAAGGQLVATVVLVDRTGELRDVVSTRTGVAYPAHALWSLSLPTYQPGRATCPGCRSGLSLESPGSSGTAARPA